MAAGVYDEAVERGIIFGARNATTAVDEAEFTGTASAALSRATMYRDNFPTDARDHFHGQGVTARRLEMGLKSRQGTRA